MALCSEYKATLSDTGDGDFKRTKSWRKKFKKEKGGKEKAKGVDAGGKRLTTGTESDSSLPSVSSGSDVTSPRRPRKSPLAGRLDSSFLPIMPLWASHKDIFNKIVLFY